MAVPAVDPLRVTSRLGKPPSSQARGPAQAELTSGIRRSTKAERTSWTPEADKVIVF